MMHHEEIAMKVGAAKFTCWLALLLASMLEETFATEVVDCLKVVIKQLQHTIMKVCQRYFSKFSEVEDGRSGRHTAG